MRMLTAGGALALLAAHLATGGRAVAQESWETRYSQRAEALAPDDARGHYALARWCEQCDRPEEAIRHYRIVLDVDPHHARARGSLEAIERAQRAGEGPSDGSPREPGRYDLTVERFVGREGRPARYTLLIPEAAARGEPLPLVVVSSWRDASSGDPSVSLSKWEGFEGYVAVACDEVVDWHPEYAAGIAEAVIAAGCVDRDFVLISDWHLSTETFRLVGERPDLFRYGYSDSPWGGFVPDLPTTVPPERQALLQEAHVYMKLTGEGYSESDRGYDDARAAGVVAFWEALGVRDVQIERHPRGQMGPEPNGQAREWFERKIQEVRTRRRLAVEYERRAAEVPAGDPRALFRLGDWCEKQGLTERAIEVYRRVLELDPAHAQARRNLRRMTGGP